MYIGHIYGGKYIRDTLALVPNAWPPLVPALLSNPPRRFLIQFNVEKGFGSGERYTEEKDDRKSSLMCRYIQKNEISFA